MNSLLTTIGVGLGLFASIKALVSKSDLELVFLTQEQIIKLKLYRLIGLSASLGILITDIYFIWSLMFEDKTYKTIDWNYMISIFLLWFILGLMFISLLRSIINVVFSRYHYKYKVNIPETGDVYLLKMMTQDVCICSKNPNSQIDNDDSEAYLISIDDIKNRPLSKVKLQKPQSYIQKLIKYNTPNI
ncbi:hypothetical protein [Robertmurraya sp. P23]|uniref:hypothetical protein n=1 Tax=Robertmurraya sp. P23 TaxID=3436931 RepID=UPI003D99217B